MKKLLPIIFILLFSFTVFGQTKQEKEAAKKAEKIRKEQEKQEKKARDTRINQMMVDGERLVKFPQDYIERTIRVKSLWLGRTELYEEVDGRAYFVETKVNANTGTSPYALPNSLAFIMSEPDAKEVFDYYREKAEVFRDYYPAHVIAAIKKHIAPNGSVYYFARIDCIEFIGVFRDTWKRIGKCSEF